MRTKQEWNKVDKELQKRLAKHKYSFEEVVKIIGTGERVVRRYMDSQLIHPIKVSNEWKFTDDMLHKAMFIQQCRKEVGWNVESLAGLYDYLREHNIKPDIEQFIEKVQTYWGGYNEKDLNDIDS